MKKIPPYLTKKVKDGILSRGEPLSKPMARDFGLTYKKLITCYRFLGLSIESKVKKERRETIEYCRERLSNDSQITVRQLAKELGRHEVGLAKLLRKTGIRSFTKQLRGKDSDRISNEIMTRFGSKSLPHIAKELGVTIRQARRLTGKLKMKRNTLDSHSKSGRINALFFDSWRIDETVAYIVGLLWADGCLHYRKYNGKISQKVLSISLIDRKMIERISREMGNTYKISEFKNKDKVICGIMCKNLKKSFGISIPNLYIASRLEEIGMTERKSSSACTPSYTPASPEGVRRAFLRGYIDGDGCHCICMIKINSYYLISAIFNSYNQMKTIMDFAPCWLRYNFDHRVNKKTGKTLWNARVSLSDSLRFANWLYKDSSIHLKRKYRKYKKACSMKKIDPCGKYQGD